MQSLIVDDFGTYLGKRSERVSVRYRDKDREKEEHPLMDLDQIVITSRGVSMSSDLIEACTERGIEIAFLSFNGKPYAKLNSPSLTATVISRREQLAAYHDERGLEIAKQFATRQTKEPDQPHPLLRQIPQETGTQKIRRTDGAAHKDRRTDRRNSGLFNPQPLRQSANPRSTAHAAHYSTSKDAPVPSTGNASNACSPPDASPPATIKVQPTT